MDPQCITEVVVCLEVWYQEDQWAPEVWSLDQAWTQTWSQEETLSLALEVPLVCPAIATPNITPTTVNTTKSQLDQPTLLTIKETLLDTKTNPEHSTPLPQFQSPELIESKPMSPCKTRFTTKHQTTCFTESQWESKTSLTKTDTSLDTKTLKEKPSLPLKLVEFKCTNTTLLVPLKKSMVLLKPKNLTLLITPEFNDKDNKRLTTPKINNKLLIPPCHTPTTTTTTCTTRFQPTPPLWLILKTDLLDIKHLPDKWFISPTSPV